MKLFSLDGSLYELVSHDPGLKKKVLARDTPPCVSQISHIILQTGSSVSEHFHNNYFEVFYCIRGKAVFLIKGESVPIKKGCLLIVEPGELHAIPDVIEETELLYLHTSL
jgi:mannose-6-phosphate isomerase-like protein (cupin superfamily)